MAGDRVVTATVDGAVLGLSICYDLRFPELYRALALAGAEILTVPANCTECCTRAPRDHQESHGVSRTGVLDWSAAPRARTWSGFGAALPHGTD